MAETVWSGFLRLSLLSCPVRLAPASQAPAAAGPELRNCRTGNPVKQQFVDARTGDIVPAEAIIHGADRPEADGEMFGCSDSEAPGGPDDIIDIVHFCPVGQIDRQRFSNSCRLDAEGPLAADTLASLRLAMQRLGAEAVAHLRLEKRLQTALITADGAGLLLRTLRPLLAHADFAGRPDSEVPPEMVDIAEEIIRRGMREPDASLLPHPDAGSPAGEPEADAALAAALPEPPGHDQGRDLGAEILLHVIGLGDRRFVEPGWAGSPGSREQVEAISIRARDELAPSAIEYRVFASAGRVTSWVSDGNYAGTRDCQLPLTGFAVRPAPEHRDTIDIVYEGCFFDGGVVGPRMNGETCVSPIDDDPLEAVRISIIERRDTADEDSAARS
ncbi:MAG TPA: Ku protein [Stellaceae bacterium]|nr:Ku protein [Stellaceae bacterium]